MAKLTPDEVLLLMQQRSCGPLTVEWPEWVAAMNQDHCPVSVKTIRSLELDDAIKYARLLFDKQRTFINQQPLSNATLISKLLAHFDGCLVEHE
jgi:hypothetical protein